MFSHFSEQAFIVFHGIRFTFTVKLWSENIKRASNYYFGVILNLAWVNNMNLYHTNHMHKIFKAFQMNIIHMSSVSSLLHSRITYLNRTQPSSILGKCRLQLLFCFYLIRVPELKTRSFQNYFHILVTQKWGYRYRYSSNIKIFAKFPVQRRPMRLREVWFPIRQEHPQQRSIQEPPSPVVRDPQGLVRSCGQGH